MGIHSSNQLKKKELKFWWQKKYKDIKDSQLKEETIKDKLMEINEIYEELSRVDENLLVEIIIKKSNEENKVISDIDLYKEGLELYYQNEYQKSIKKFSEAIYLNQDKPDYFKMRGWAYYFFNKEGKAIKDANKAIDLNPDEPQHFRLRGWAYYFLKNYKKAIEDANKAIDLNPDDPGHFNLRGWAYFGLKNYEKAIEDTNKAIDLNPDDPDHFYLRGKAYSLSQNYKKAIKDATRAISLNPDNPNYYRLRAFARPEESKEYIIDKNIADNLEDIKNYLNEADRYFENNRIIEAIDYYEKVLSKSSSEIKKILGNDAMIRINNRILEYRRMINS